MAKPFEWKFDARELMSGKYIIPKGARIFLRRKWAEVALQKVMEQSTELLIMRVWTCPGGWVVMNHHYEVIGGERGGRRKTWHALVPRA